MAEKLDSENILLITDSYKVRRLSLCKIQWFTWFPIFRSHFVVFCVSLDGIPTSGSTAWNYKKFVAGCYQIYRLFSLQTGITSQAVSLGHHRSIFLLWKQRRKVSRSVLLRFTILDKGVWQEVRTFTFPFELASGCLFTFSVFLTRALHVDLSAYKMLTLCARP